MNLHLISDATGETINAIARATTVQFDHVDILYHRWSLIRSRLQLHRVIGGIEAEPGPVLSTLVDRALNVELVAACERLSVPVINVLQPVLDLLQGFIGTRARPGQASSMSSMPTISAASMRCTTCWRMTTARRSRA